MPLLGDGAAAAIASPVAPAAPTPEAVSQAAGLLQRALQEGYSAALRINRSHPQALVGAAEAHAGMAKLAGLAGSGDARATHLREAVSHYEAALQAPEKLGGFLDRCDVRWVLGVRVEAAMAHVCGVGWQLCTVICVCDGIYCMAASSKKCQVRPSAWRPSFPALPCRYNYACVLAQAGAAQQVRHSHSSMRYPLGA